MLQARTELSMNSAATSLSSDKNVFRLRGHLSRLTGQVMPLLDYHFAASYARLVVGLDIFSQPRRKG